MTSGAAPAFTPFELRTPRLMLRFLLRERWIVDGELSDTAFYGLLAREFTQRL